MSKVLITGGAGFIGSQITKKLLDMGHQPIIFDIFAQYISPLDEGYKESRYDRFKEISDKIIIERGNVSHYGTVMKVLSKHKPEYIIHLAAIPLAKLQNATVHEGLEGAVISTSYILETLEDMMKSGVLPSFKKFVYASSSMVYGNFESSIISETHPTNPINIYGTVKLAGEKITEGLCRTYNIPYNIVRPSAVYGPTDINRRVSQIFIDNALKNKDLEIYGGESEMLDFTYVSDIAEGFILSAFTEVSGETFNITGGNARSLLDYANILKSYLPDIKINLHPRDETLPKRGTLSIEKATKILGYSPKYDLEKGIKEYISFKKQEPL